MSTNEPMSLAQAMVVCDQASPMPAVASAALRTLRGELLPHLAYEKFVEDYWRGRRAGDYGRTGEDYHEDLRDLFIMTTGLGGEAGEVQELIKKAVRGRYEPDRRELALELGDVLYYLTKLAHRYGLTLADLRRINREKLEARRQGGKDAYTATNVVLNAQPVDWERLVASFPPSVAQDLRRAAGFLEGTEDADSVITDEEARRIATVLRALAAAGVARVEAAASSSVRAETPLSPRDAMALGVRVPAGDPSPANGEIYAGELEDLRAVAEQGRRLRATAPVDDDFPRVMEEFDLALGRYQLAKKAVGRG